jgi:D-galacturonate reductase
MKYSPSPSGHFDGQHGYGYISIEKFVQASREVNAGQTTPDVYDGGESGDGGLPTIKNTVSIISMQRKKGAQ